MSDQLGLQDFQKSATVRLKDFFNVYAALARQKEIRRIYVKRNGRNGNVTNFQQISKRGKNKVFTICNNTYNNYNDLQQKEI